MVCPFCTSMPNFVKMDQTVAEISQFWIFKLAAAAISDFQKFENVTVGSLCGGKMTSCAKFHQNQTDQTVAKISRSNGFDDGGWPPFQSSWTTADDYLHPTRKILSGLYCCALQNLVRIDAESRHGTGSLGHQFDPVHVRPQFFRFSKKFPKCRTYI